MSTPDLSALMGARSNLTAGASLASLLVDIGRRGGYDSNPDSANYARNHHTQPLRPGEQVQRAYPAVVGVKGSSVPAVVRETNGGTVYVDPYRLPPAPGLIGGFAARRVRSAGLQQPMVFDPGQVRVTERPGRVVISTPQVQVRGLPDAPLGPVKQLSPGQQLRHAWNLARG